MIRHASLIFSLMIIFHADIFLRHFIFADLFADAAAAVFAAAMP
jgi:hypothetical protein